MAGKLRDLKFLPISVQVLSVERISRVLIKWDLAPTAQNLKDFKFFVDRGESPSEFKQLNTTGLPAVGLREFVDLTANLLDLQKVYYYRVRGVEFIGTTPVQTFTSAVSTFKGDLDLVGIYVVDEHLFLERWVAGVPVMIFKKRRDGGRCPECWDSVLQRVTSSNCETCYGTGKLGGFYPPIESWMLVEPDPKVVQVAEWGRAQPNQTDIQFTNYPLLSVDDVIVEMQLDRRWKISNIRQPEKNRSAMLQVMRVSAINPTDVEYRVAVDEDRRSALVAELMARNKETEF